MMLFMRLLDETYFVQSHSILSPRPPTRACTPLYSFLSDSRSVLSEAWEFSMALGYEDMPVQVASRLFPDVGRA